jgi:hypothetical protein
MGYIYNILLLILVLFSFYCGIKRGFKAQHYLFVYLFVTFLIDVLFQLKIIWKNTPSFNGVYYKYYFLFCINYFAYFYYLIWDKIRRKIALGLGVILTIGIILTVDFSHPFFENQLSISLPVFYVLISLIWFHFKLTRKEESGILDDPYFWISSGLILWGGFFLFRIIPAKYLYENDVEFNQFLKFLNYIVSCIMYLLFFVALLKFKRNEISLK